MVILIIPCCQLPSTHIVNLVSFKNTCMWWRGMSVIIIKLCILCLSYVGDCWLVEALFVSDEWRSEKTIIRPENKRQEN